MQINRREFLKRSARLSAGIASMSLPYFLSKCSEKISGPSENKRISFKDYIPEVNSKPYMDPKYSFKKEVNSSGILSLDELGIFGDVAFRDEHGNDIKGLETYLYGEDVFGTKVLIARDPQERYVPSMMVLDSGLGKPSNGIDYLVLHTVASRLGSTGDVALDLVYLDLPSWTPENADDLPGFVYLGNWSFDDLRGLNTILKYGSIIVSVLFPNPVTIATAGFFVKSDSFLDKVDTALDLLYESAGIGLDTDKEYSIYVSPSNAPYLVLFPYNWGSRSEVVSYEDLFPTKPGTWWRFRAGYGQEVTAMIAGEKNVNGKNLLVVKNEADTEEYYGFFGDAFRFFGFYFPGIGDVFFDPPIVVGDGSIRVGKSYHSRSEIIFKDKPDLVGSIEEKVSYIDRENVLALRKPYGDCFKVNENTKITLKNNDGEISDTEDSFISWFAKNVGKVKGESPFGLIELEEMNIVSKLGKPCRMGKPPFSSFNPIAQKILDLCKRVR